LRRRGLVALAAAALAAAGCRDPGSDAERPNVLLIVIDSLRRDRLGCYGHAQPTSPHLDALAASGIRFDRAFSTAPWTMPAVASLLTSRSPSAAGIRSARHRLPDALRTLAEVLRDHGYATGAVISHSYLSARWNFQQGFDRFEERNVRPPGQATSAGVTDDALAFLDAPRAGPFFLFAHYFDPHFPYLEHPGFEMPRGEAYAGPIRSGLPWRELRERAGELGPADAAELLRLYDSEIAFTDAQIGRLLDGLAERGLAERTLVIATADHGEEFLDHGGLGHTRTLHGELLAIPLIVRSPGRAPGVDALPASLLDLYPTVLEAAGIPVPGDAEGATLLAPRAPARALFAETWRSAALRSVASGDRKLIHDERRGRTLFFDLGLDPGERRDLAASAAHAEEIARMRALLEAGRVAPAEPGAPVEVPEAERRRLRELGYAE
jgi:arylsulfatase